ncbi:hypothetical protein [Ruegeria sp. HKCCSP351]|uniref:hypothetical protein n=1 Tax=Ruegeria sp. HKCCSP351 TaxID=2794832 RepID=UPI001AE4AE5E|nr:hypothetical protein [Ruegeria sp. HKCCSP351]
MDLQPEEDSLRLAVNGGGPINGSTFDTRLPQRLKPWCGMPDTVLPPGSQAPNGLAHLYDPNRSVKRVIRSRGYGGNHV